MKSHRHYPTKINRAGTVLWRSSFDNRLTSVPSRPSLYTFAPAGTGAVNDTLNRTMLGGSPVQGFDNPPRGREYDC